MIWVFFFIGLVVGFSIGMFTIQVQFKSLGWLPLRDNGDTEDWALLQWASAGLGAAVSGCGAFHCAGLKCYEAALMSVAVGGFALPVMIFLGKALVAGAPLIGFCCFELTNRLSDWITGNGRVNRVGGTAYLLQRYLSKLDRDGKETEESKQLLHRHQGNQEFIAAVLAVRATFDAPKGLEDK